MIAYTVLPKEIHSPVAKAILEMGAIRYVITPKDCFFILKFPGSYLEPYQEVEDSDSYAPVSIFGFKTEIVMHPRNFCYIYDGEKLMSRKVNNKTGRFEGMIEEQYLAKYQKQINKSPEFQLDSMFTAKLKTVSLKKQGAKTIDNKDPGSVIIPEYLMLQEGMKIISQKHWLPISRLLREIKLFKNKEKEKVPLGSEQVKILKYLKDKFKSNPKKSLRELEILVQKKAAKLSPNNSRMADELSWSKTTIWRKKKKK